jgi:hypothetical protein
MLVERGNSPQMPRWVERWVVVMVVGSVKTVADCETSDGRRARATGEPEVKGGVRN